MHSCVRLTTYSVARCMQAPVLTSSREGGSLEDFDSMSDETGGLPSPRGNDEKGFRVFQRDRVSGSTGHEDGDDDEGGLSCFTGHSGEEGELLDEAIYDAMTLSEIYLT